MSDQRLVILGGGESGVGAALLAKNKGLDVFLSDRGALREGYRTVLRDSGIPFEERQHTEEYILQATEVVKSPGIPDSAPLVQQLRAKNIPIISEIEFAARYTNAKLIGITGSNGKTTTTLLLYHLLKVAGLNVGIAGNIGDSFAKQVIEDTFDYYVLELSSFQLDNMFQTKLNTAILLNITPDHLDRYSYNFQNYVNSKFRILQNMTSIDDFIFFIDDSTIAGELTKKPVQVNYLPISLKSVATSAGYFANNQLTTIYKGQHFQIDTKGLPLKGKHNAVNMLAAILAAQSIGIDLEKLTEGLNTFQNAAHRLEPAGKVNGIEFINDSKATNVDSVYYALESMVAPIIWIAGGEDKGNDYNQLNGLARDKVKALICLGQDNRKLIAHFTGIVPTLYETQDIMNAVRHAFMLAEAGDVVLLSPACASFDLFRNYQDRGEQFKQAVKQIAQ